MDPISELNDALAGRYLVERELGRGGMATVYLAEDLKHHRHVAIKVLHAELAAVIGAERFLREIETIAHLQHPHILGLIDSGEVRGTAYYVMPFVEGESLRGRLERETQLPVADAVRIAIEVAGALDYAHRHGVIHRDVKPENILLHDGSALVADFGIALAVNAPGSRMTETGLSLGTPHYMSPEQATAEKNLTSRSDVYSLGAVLYEMLAGHPPHTGASPQQVIMKIVTEDVAPISRIRKSVPSHVDAAVAKALERLPADRFDSAKDLAHALANPTPAIAARSPANAPRRRGWVGIAATVAAAVVIVAVVLGVRQSPPSPLAYTQLTFASQAIFNARFASDGRTIVFSATPDTTDAPHLFVIRPESPDPQPIGPDSAHLLSISSTGAMAVLVHAHHIGARLFKGTLATMSIGDRGARETASNVSEADWSPDGKEMAVVRDSSQVFSIEYPVGHTIARTSGYFSDIRLSPKGDALAYFEHPQFGDDRGAAVIADRSGKTLARSAIYGAVEGIAWAPGGDHVLYTASSSSWSDYTARSLDARGNDRVAVTEAGGLTVQDATQRGRLLITRDVQPLFIFGRRAGMAGGGEAQIAAREGAHTPVISRDGRVLVFTDQGATGGPTYSTVIQPMADGPAVRLGEGQAVAVSDDNRSVLSMVAGNPLRLMVYPTGAGQSRRIDHGEFDGVFNGSFDGSDGRVFVCGVERGRGGERCFVISSDGSARPVTPEGTVGVISLDGTRTLTWRSSSEAPRIYSTSNNASLPSNGLRVGDAPVRWSPDGREVWVSHVVDHDATLEIDRVDPQTGSRSMLLQIPVRDARGRHAGIATLADDPRVYALSRFSFASSLFAVDGFR